MSFRGGQTGRRAHLVVDAPLHALVVRLENGAPRIGRQIPLERLIQPTRPRITKKPRQIVPRDRDKPRVDDRSLEIP